MEFSVENSNGNPFLSAKCLQASNTSDGISDGVIPLDAVGTRRTKFCDEVISDESFGIVFSVRNAIFRQKVELFSSVILLQIWDIFVVRKVEGVKRY